MRTQKIENRYALCVGVNAPPNHPRPLNYAEKDAEEVYNQFLKLGISKDNSALLVGPKATVSNLVEYLNAFTHGRDPNNNDLIIFYFAGHSELIRVKGSKYQQVFLATYDFDEQAIISDKNFRQKNALSLGKLKNEFFTSKNGCRKRLFVLDSCHSGDFAGMDYRGEPSLSIKDRIEEVLSLKRNHRCALLSCLPEGKAYESHHLKHGVFTYHFLQALKGKYSEHLFNGWLTVTRLRDCIVEKLPEQQRPTLHAPRLEDVFHLFYFPEHDHSQPPVSKDEVEQFVDDNLGELLKQIRHLNEGTNPTDPVEKLAIINLPLFQGDKDLAVKTVENLSNREYLIGYGNNFHLSPLALTKF